MCVIIKRKPGIEIPEKKIWSACIVNNDGFGMSVIDRGKIETFKLYPEGGNKSVDILKRLEDAKDNLVYLHLRYTTAGKTNTTNCHPFETFKDGDFEIQFMHNGTLSSFKELDDYSDTWHFNAKILKPTIAAFYQLKGKDVLKDETVKRIIKGFKGSSVFTLYDSEGNDLILENSSCKDHGGWWSSNEYSFNRKHREKDDDGPFGYWSGGSYNSYSPTNRGNTCGVPANSGVKVVSSTTITPTTTKSPSNSQAVSFISTDNKNLKEQAKKTGYAIMQAKRQGIVNRYHTPPSKRATFIELADIDDLKNIMVLSEDEIFDLCNEQPVVGTALIMDLIFELWKKEQDAKRITTSTPSAVVAND